MNFIFLKVHFPDYSLFTDHLLVRYTRDYNLCFKSKPCSLSYEWPLQCTWTKPSVTLMLQILIVSTQICLLKVRITCLDMALMNEKKFELIQVNTQTWLCCGSQSVLSAISNKAEKAEIIYFMWTCWVWNPWEQGQLVQKEPLPHSGRLQPAQTHILDVYSPWNGPHGSLLHLQLNPKCEWSYIIRKCSNAHTKHVHCACRTNTTVVNQVMYFVQYSFQFLPSINNI